MPLELDEETLTELGVSDGMSPFGEVTTFLAWKLKNSIQQFRRGRPRGPTLHAIRRHHAPGHKRYLAGHPKKCLWCGETYKPKRTDQKFCCRSHKQRFAYAQKRLKMGMLGNVGSAGSAGVPSCDAPRVAEGPAQATGKT